MMRITQQLLTNQIRQNAGRASERMNRAIQQIQEDSSVPAPSVDPIKASRVKTIDERLRNHESLGRSRATVRSNMTLADTTLESLSNLVLNMRDEALAVATDNAGDKERTTVAVGLRRKLESVIALGNTRDGSDRYLFGGLADSAPPFAPDGTYNGDANSREVEVAPGVRLTTTLSGSDVFGTTNDTITALTALVTALEAGDLNAARAQLTPINNGHAQLVKARTTVGGRLATLEDLDMLTLDVKTTLGVERGEETAVDFARLTSEMANAQANLQAIIETSKTLMAQSSGAWLNS